ncbi:nifU-like protein 4, mitochondrial isoform X3 [Rhododendron vialii]|uniref:nifU-like protein 4, mitochondrial isoform X3 n=1 Tax=Rhododendron vialii TaxID=182163 RepID=UPI00265E8C2A|nr:nifU-like protein 4, mitochondrial isoform X3 [Rhododendron vialii]
MYFPALSKTKNPFQERERERERERETMKSLRRLLRRGLVCRRTELCTGSGAPYASRRLLLLDSSAASTSQNRSASSAFPPFKSTSIPPFHSSKWDLLRGLSLVGINGTPRYVTGRELSGMGMIEFSHTFGSLSKRARNIKRFGRFNPSSLMFYPGKQVMEVGCTDFPNAHSAMNSPLAKALFGIDGVTRVFFGSNFITITKSHDVAWDILKPEISAAIEDFYSSGKPPFLDSNAAASMDTAIRKYPHEYFMREHLEACLCG